MIALDTNVLLGYFVQDGGIQASIATQLIEEELSLSDQGFVSLAVVCELVWALRITYRQTQTSINGVLRELIEAPQIHIEQQELVTAAISEAAGDIADTIIHLVGKSKGCTKTVTFDRKFARVPGVELLTT